MTEHSVPGPETTSHPTEQQLQANLAEKLKDTGYTYQVLDQLPIDTEQLPLHIQSYLEEVPNHSQKFLTAQEDGVIVGFVLLLIPDDDPAHVDLRMRYVQSDKRGAGLGTHLREYLYTWALENKVQTIQSGINYVATIDATGAHPGYSNEEGTWRSYKSARRAEYAEGVYPKMSLAAAKLGIRSSNSDFVDVDVTIKTHIRDEQGNIQLASEPTLPDSPEELIRTIQPEIAGMEFDTLVKLLDAHFQVLNVVNGTATDFFGTEVPLS